MFFDLPLEELRIYKPDRKEPPDFDSFWQQTLNEARSYPIHADFKSVDYGMRLVDTYDVTFNGFDNQRIKGWFLLPTDQTEKIPCVVQYIGYGGGRGFPFDWLLWSCVGYATLIMDLRGQGTTWRKGDTPDREPEGSSPQFPGHMTKGILDPKTYYYRRLMTDAVRAVDAARAFPLVDETRLGITGGSQGGGLALAVAGLEHSVSAVMADVPFLCHYRRAVEISDSAPYSEISRFCKTHRDKVEHVFQTLSYFDGLNFAARAKAKALFSVALMDMTCPPSTVYAAFNHYTGPKEIRVWEFNDHEGGESYQTVEQIQFLAKIWG